jgi:membrane fusion protein, copper/silver efflux system
LAPERRLRRGLARPKHARHLSQDGRRHVDRGQSKGKQEKHHVAVLHPSRRIRREGAVMKRAILIYVTVAAATVGAWLAAQSGRLPSGHAGMTSAVAQETPAKTPRRIKYYRNPMGLPDTSPTPKKDSMGMDYIAVYDGEDASDGTVSIGPGKLQKTGVRSEPVRRQVLNVPVRAPGSIEQDERRVSIVAFRFEGFIESVENVTTGQHVHKGQILMRVYSPALASAAAEYISVLDAKAASGITGQAIRGAKQRLENLGMSEPAIAEIERTRQMALSVPWLAPQDGEILERAAVNGMRAAPGAVLFRIADHQVVWAMADIAERDLALISIGQKVAVRPRAYPNRVFSGEVALIYPHLNAQTRTARIRVELPNPDELLRPDMYADVEIATGTETPVLTVSDSAVIDSGERQLVLLDKGEGRFEPRPVKLGRGGDGRVEIIEGLAEGDQVVVSANFLIDAESNLKAALNGLDAGDKSQ